MATCCSHDAGLTGQTTHAARCCIQFVYQESVILSWKNNFRRSPYVNRTTLGWPDTDCLILTFTLCAGALAFGAGASRDRGRRARYLLAAVGNAVLFAWWWDQALEAVALICLVPLIVSAALCYRPGRGEALAVAGVAAIAAAACLALWPDPIMEGLRTIMETARYGIRGGGGRFPNSAEDVSELQPVSSPAILFPVLMLGIGGLARPLRRTPRAAAVTLLVPVLLALSVAIIGSRALIFWAPVIGLSVASLMPATGPNAQRHSGPWPSRIPRSRFGRSSHKLRWWRRDAGVVLGALIRHLLNNPAPSAMPA